jgi:hypothetical protein
MADKIGRLCNKSKLKIPCSKLQGIFDRKECGLFYDSLAYPAASGGECARFRGSRRTILATRGVDDFKIKGWKAVSKPWITSEGKAPMA